MARNGNKFKVTSDIRDTLLASPEIAAMIGNKIFPLIAPENTAGDFIVYQRDKYSVDTTKMGIDGQTVEVWINIVSDDYDRSQTLADTVFNVLYGYKTDENGFSVRIDLLDSTEDYENGKYIQILLFSIT